MRKPLRTALAALAVATITAGCVEQNKPGVGVVRFDSSAVFGAAKTTELPGFDVPEPFVEDSFDSGSPVLPQPVLPQPLAGPKGPCPEAQLTDFPKKSAGVNIEGTPPPGVYQWKRVSVVRKDESRTPPRSERPFALETRAIRRIERQNDHQYSFEMVAPDPAGNGNTVITTFVVNTNPVLLVDRTISGRTIGVVPVGTQDVRIGNPADEGGVFISRIETQDQKGSRVSNFEPTRPFMVLPLDGGIVRGGETFQSLAIDPDSQTVLLNDGLVTRTLRVDACGDVVEGYAVSLKQTFTTDIVADTPEQAAANIENYSVRRQTRTADFVFATQYGAMPIQEVITIGDLDLDPVAFTGRWELGGLTPSPLPDSLK